MRQFRTKRGRCVTDGDTLRLESSLVGYYTHIKDGNRPLFWFIVAAVALGTVNILYLLTSVDSEPVIVGALVGSVVGVGVVGGWRAVKRLRGFTSDDEIRVGDIRRVKTFEGVEGLRRPRFVVEYDRDGKEKKRYIRMPSRLLSFGEDEFEKAKQTFRELGFTV